MNRRGFLGSILALASAPAIVRADSLMRIVPREMRVITFPLTEPVVVNGFIREMTAYDAYSDKVLVRYDAIVDTPEGLRSQFSTNAALGYDVSRHEQERSHALQMLKAHITFIHGRPVTGVLKIPAGTEGRFL